MLGDKRKETASIHQVPDPNLNADGARKIARTEARRGSISDGHEESRVLPAMSALSVKRITSKRGSRKYHPETGGAMRGSGEPPDRQSMNAFDDLLSGVDAYLGIRHETEQNAGMVDSCRSEFQGYGSIHYTVAGPLNVSGQTNKNRQHGKNHSGRYDNGGRLPCLRGLCSVVPANGGDPGQAIKMYRSSSCGDAQPLPPSASAVVDEHSSHTGRELYSLDDDPFDLMLWSKAKARSRRGKLFRLEGECACVAPEDSDGGGEFSHNEFGAKRAWSMATDDVSRTAAGVFRVSHDSTGFVHYDYTWDIAGAKAGQLRKLRSKTRDNPHPHRGLSSLTRGTQQTGSSMRNLGGKGPKASRRPPPDEEGFRFEVIRRIPLPSMFRARGFERELRDACAQELSDRRAYLLVRMAQHYRCEHVGAAFRRIKTVCQEQTDHEMNAAVTEIQRTWMGCRGRASARLQREQLIRKRIKVKANIAGAIVAIWAQARHRGKSGRRTASAAVLQRNSETSTRKGFEGASVLQKSFRPALQTVRKSTAVGVCEDVHERVTQPIDDPRNIEDQHDSDTTNAKAAQLPASPGRGPARPQSSSATRRNTLSSELEAFLMSEASSGSGVPAEPAEIRSSDITSAGGQMQAYAHDELNGGMRQERRQRPSSSRRHRNSLLLSEVLVVRNKKRLSTGDGAGRHSVAKEQAEWRSIVRQHNAASTDSELPVGGATDPVCATGKRDPRDYFGPDIPDASRLVLEDDPQFVAASAIQAVWRGYIARLALRKRRRAAVALRRKREGKWRQQRGVVGKQKAVGWDERREMEDGAGVEGSNAGVQGVRGSTCVDIQRIWRGAVGRRTARATRLLQRERREVCIQIQKIFRGAKGRRRAMEVLAMRYSQVAAAHLITREGRRFVRRASNWRRRRHLAATVIQCVVRGLTGRRRALQTRRNMEERKAARTIVSAVRCRIGRRQARQRTVLRRMGACGMCCTRLPDMFLEATEQELCFDCYRRTVTMLENKNVAVNFSMRAFEIVEHRERERAARATQRAWALFQHRASAKFGVCEACRRRKGSGRSRPRATRAVCMWGCDRRRHLRYCRRCCAVAHSLRATAGHEIRGVDRYGVEMAAAATLGKVMWRYNVKRRFWKLFFACRRTLNRSATLVQSRWRCYHCHSIFAALRRSFLYVEAAVRSVERYWLVAGDGKSAIIATIAGFLAYDVHGSPPGLYPAPSGELALWEMSIRDTVRQRAAYRLQQAWKDKVLRVASRAIADQAREEMVNGQLLRAAAEVRGSIAVQRVWRGHSERLTARKRTFTRGFARVVVAGYTDTGRFANENLRAFNAHNGYLGSAGVNARSLLGAATATWANRNEVATSTRARPADRRMILNRPTLRASAGQVCRRLKHVNIGGGGVIKTQVAGTHEVSVRVSLQRHNDLHPAGRMIETGLGLNIGSRTADGEMSRRPHDFTKCHSSPLSERKERQNSGTGRPPCTSSCDDGTLSKELEDGDVPPLTLKLEVISVMESFDDRTSFTSRPHAEIINETIVTDGNHYDTELGPNESCSRSKSNAPSTITGVSASNSTQTKTTFNSRSDDWTSNETSSDDSMTGSAGGSTRYCDTARLAGSLSATNSSTSAVECSPSTGGERRRVQSQHQYCDVKWCGASVGGTRAPSTGLPIPRWESQIFYLPLCAVLRCGHGVAVEGKRSPTKRSSEEKDNVLRCDWCDTRHDVLSGNGLDKPPSSPRQNLSLSGISYEAKDTKPLPLPLPLPLPPPLAPPRSPTPELLVVTLNKLSRRGGGDMPDAMKPSYLQRLRKGHPDNESELCQLAGTVATTTKEEQGASPWSAFLSGKAQVEPVGRTVLQAEDVLSMLGSQQVVDMPAISCGRKRVDRHHPCSSQDEESSGEFSISRGWKLRLLLSLEEEGRTRARLLVTEVVKGVLAAIIDTIPSKVARIELRVTGTRTLPVTPSKSEEAYATRLGPVRPLCLCAEWNGDHAAVIDVLPNDSSHQSAMKYYAATHANGRRRRKEDRTDSVAALEAQQRKAKPRLVMLPMLLSTPKGNNWRRSEGGGTTCGSKDRRRGKNEKRTPYGLGPRGAFRKNNSCDPGNGEEGRSQCLRLTVRGYTATSADTDGGIGEDKHGNRDGYDAQATLFERDLVRREWTEILVPLHFHGDEKHDTSSQVRRCTHRKCSETRQRSYSNVQKTQRRRTGFEAYGAQGKIALVLQVRSVGFQPEPPPLWLVRRDFTERAVRRIIEAATAAVAQPCVEVTLLGLSGAVNSLLPARRSERDDTEILCEAFWNGILTRSICLRRVKYSSPGIVPQKPLRTTSPVTTHAKDWSSASHTNEAAIAPHDVTRHETSHGNAYQDPASWFLDKTQGSDLNNRSKKDTNASDQDTWVSLGSGVSPSSQPMCPVNEAMNVNQSAHTNNAAVAVDGCEEKHCHSGKIGVGSFRKQGCEKIRRGTSNNLVWIPAEDDFHRGQTLRFFFSPSFSDNPANDQGTEPCFEDFNDEGRPDTKCVNGSHGINGTRTGRDIADHGTYSNGPEMPSIVPQSGSIRSKDRLRGALRLVFWASHCSSSQAEGSTKAGDQMIDMEWSRDDTRRIPKEEDSRQEPADKTGEDKGRTLLGFATLLDDELVLHPPGERVNLALLGDPGQKAFASLIVDYELKRKARSYRVTDAHITVVVRHFDIPRSLLLHLQCPAPFLEVEVIDCHRLPKASGEFLSTNPYVVLMMNGKPFARSTTLLGTTNPVWASETFRVQLPSPPPGAWHLATPQYFQAYSADPLVLGARVYSQGTVESSSQSALEAAGEAPPQSYGAGEGDLLLGEARLPFSLLEDSPFHYLPLRLSRPRPPPTSSSYHCTASCAGVIGSTGFALTDEVKREGSSRCTIVYSKAACNACDVRGCSPTTNGCSGPGHTDDSSGLLGIRVDMVFPTPTIPTASSAPSGGAFLEASSWPPAAVSVAGIGSGAADDKGCTHCPAVEKDAILLRIYGGESLVAHDRPGTSRNSYCVVLVNDVEAGRTGTIPRSCDPLWAANFYLSDEMLRKCTATSGKKQWGGKRTGTTNRCRGNSAAKGEGESPRSLQRGNIASVVIQVWDRVPEGEPALVGAANIPPDLLLTLLSSAPRSKYKSSDCATQAAALHTLDLRIWLQTDEEQLAHDVGGTARGGNRDSDGEIRDRDRTSEMCPSLVNATRGGDGERNRQGRAGEQPSSTGMLSLSLERRLASSAGLPIADYTYTKATHMSKEDTKGCEGSEQNMQSPALAKLSPLQQWRNSKLKTLSTTTKGARAKLEEAEAIARDTAFAPRGTSAGDCPRKNAERHVRAWAREVVRAEAAETLTARSPTGALEQERRNQDRKNDFKRPQNRTKPRESPTSRRRSFRRGRTRKMEVSSARSLSRNRGGIQNLERDRGRQPSLRKKFRLLSDDGADGVMARHCTVAATNERIEAAASGVQARAGDETSVFIPVRPECKDYEGTKGKPKQEAQDDHTILARMLPLLPAARRSIFLSVEAVTGLAQQPTAERGGLVAKIFWCGREVGRTRNKVFAFTPPSPGQRGTLDVPHVGGLDTKMASESNRKTDAGITAHEGMMSKASEAASAVAAAATVVTPTVAAGGSSESGKTTEWAWKSEHFMLPFPEDGDDDSDNNASGRTKTADDVLGGVRDGHDRDGGKSKNGAKADAMEDSLHGQDDSQGTDKDCSGDSDDDGVHLRVEIWSGKHCCGQVELGGVELERMCKKVLNASVDGGADFVVVDGNGITRLPDYFPHYLPNPKMVSATKIPLVPREGEAYSRSSASVAPARLVLTLLVVEPGQAAAAEAQLAVGLAEVEARAVRQAERAGSGEIYRDRNDPNDVVQRDAPPRAAATSDTLVKTLNIRHGPLSFRLQPLMIHFDSADTSSQGDDQSWATADARGGSCFILLARRQLLGEAQAPPSAAVSATDAATSGDKVSSTYRIATAANEDGRRRCSSSIDVFEHSQDVAFSHENSRSTVVVEDDELGRSIPFLVRSVNTIISGSFDIPAEVLVKDLPRRRGESQRPDKSINNLSGSSREHAKPAVRIVVDLVEHETTAEGNNEGEGPLFDGMTAALKKCSRAQSPLADRNNEGKQGGSVVARAILDATLLRKTIGCHRSVTMLKVRGEGPCLSTLERMDKPLAERRRSRSYVATLDLAGHVLSASPGPSRLRLQVLECQNLRPADLLGKSDPCVVVFWCGREVGRTSIISGDLNPVFSTVSAVFRLPFEPDRVTTMASSSDSPSRDRDSICTMIEEGSASNSQMYCPSLRLEVWDMDRDTLTREWKQGELLGAVVLRGPHGIVPILKASETMDRAGETGDNRTFTSTSGGSGVILRLGIGSSCSRCDGCGPPDGVPTGVFAGVISVKLALENSSEYTDAWIGQANPCVTPQVDPDKMVATSRVEVVAKQGNFYPLTSSSAVGRTKNAVVATAAAHPLLRIRCLDARGLPLGSDGYCRVFWNGRQVGRTPLASDIASKVLNSWSDGPPPPLSAYQRNPVWWIPSVTSIALGSESHDYSQRLLDDDFTAVVPFGENPVGDELTFEIFDGSSPDTPTQGSAAIDKGRKGIVEIISGRQGKTRHGAAGEPLGFVTLRGKDVGPRARHRIDVPLSPPMPGSNNKAPLTLSIALEAARTGAHTPFAASSRPAHKDRYHHQHLPQVREGLVTLSTTRQDNCNEQSEESGACVGQEARDQPPQQQEERYPKCWIRLLIQRAYLRRGHDVSGTSDPFCVVYVDRVWRKETPVCWGTLTPCWNQRFEIEIFGKGAAAREAVCEGHEIRIELWDKYIVGADNFIGETTFNIQRDLNGAVDVRTCSSSAEGTNGKDTNQKSNTGGDSSRGQGRRESLQHHTVLLCRERENAPPEQAVEGGADTGKSIGTLCFATRVRTEQSWMREVDAMNLPWALGACGVSPAAGGDLIVVQIVGAALRTGQKHLLPVPINYRRPSCFALLRWNGLTVGRTTSCRDVCEPTWQEQTFVLRMEESTMGASLEIDIYWADEDRAGTHAQGNPNVLSHEHEACSLAARSCLVGPFFRERFPAFVAEYPLFPGGGNAPSHTQPSTPKDGVPRTDGSVAPTPLADGYEVAGADDVSIGVHALNGVQLPLPRNAHPVFGVAAGNNIACRDKQDHGRKYFTTKRRDIDADLRVGSLGLRVCIVTTSVTHASKSSGRGNPDYDHHGKVDTATIGDQDDRQIRRRKTNTVNRRLRLHIRWVSLTRLLGIFETAGSRSPRDLHGREGSGNETNGIKIRTNGNTSDLSFEEEARHAPRILCRVTFCDAPVATFEVCRKSGLSLTPGECLLALPRGMAWSSCRLVIEVVVTHRRADSSSVSPVSNEHCHVLRDDPSPARQGGDGRIERGDFSPGGSGVQDASGPKSNAASHEDLGQHKILGMIEVDWQKLKELKEEALCFTTCPQEAIFSQGKRGQGGKEGSSGYLDVECALCVPITTTTRQRSLAGNRSPRQGIGRGAFTTSGFANRSAGDVNCRAWKVSPASLAISLRLERMVPSRPPRPLRAPSVVSDSSAAPVCRLRLGIVSGGPLIHVSHPDFLWSRHSWRPAFIVVGWNGYGETVGPMSEWRMQIPSISPGQRNNGAGCFSSTGPVISDILLNVPRHHRNRLVLTVGAVVASSPSPVSGIRQTEADEEGRQREEVTLGTVKIDWDGLSCLPLRTTNYFVDTVDGRSPATEGLAYPVQVELELIAPSSSPLVSGGSVQDGTDMTLGGPKYGILEAADGEPLLPSNKTQNALSGEQKKQQQPQQLQRQQTDFREKLRFGCCRTAGFSVRLNLQLEQSPAADPHILSLSPATAKRNHRALKVVPNAIAGSVVSLGDFRNPCRRERAPYLRFRWPWDDSRRAMTERRTTPVSRSPLRLNCQHAMSWSCPNEECARLSQDVCEDGGAHGAVSVRVPLMSSGLARSTLSPGNVNLRKQRPYHSAPGTKGGEVPTESARLDERSYDATSSERVFSIQRTLQRKQPSTVFIDVFDMGLYERSEHKQARRIQRAWRRALKALREVRAWWEQQHEAQKRSAAVCIQTCFRGRQGRQFARVLRIESTRRGSAATFIQCRWRSWSDRRKVEVLRLTSLRELRELQRLEQERDVRKLASRQAGLAVMVARGAALKGMDLSGLSDPFCEVRWNGTHVGQTVVRHGTRDPVWVGDKDGNALDAENATEAREWFELPFHIPEAEKWGVDPWPSMSLEIRCYDHDIVGPPDLIGSIRLGTNAILGLVTTTTATAAATDDMRHAEAIRDRAVLRTASNVATTWLELRPVNNNNSHDRNTHTLALASTMQAPPSSIIADIKTRRSEGWGTSERNPFDSCGDIAVALRARLPLPACLQEYERLGEETKGDGNNQPSRLVADAGVRTIVLAAKRALCCRDRGLWVVNATGLCKADFFGKSDPYAKVFWDGREIGMTAIRHKTLSPIWVTLSGKDGRDKRNRRSGKIRFNRSNKATTFTTTGARGEKNKHEPYFWLEGTSKSVNPTLRIEVYDWDAVGTHDFLGGVELDIEDVVKLQRATLVKARANGGSVDHQMLLKTEYPLRSRKNTEGKNGSIGLCVYLDLEQQKRRDRRKQAEIARRQQTVDRAVAETDAVNEALEREQMDAEDSTALDVEIEERRVQEQRHQSAWQLYYDETYDPPVPWWFNPETGGSTWEHPTTEALPGGPHDHDLQLVIAEEGGVGGEAQEWQMFYDNDSSDDPIPWWFNSVTGESTWDCPIAIGLATTPPKEQEQQRGPEQGEEKRLTEAALETFADGHNMGGGGGRAMVASSSLWARKWSEKYQAHYYINEVTQESSWDAPPPLDEEQHSRRLTKHHTPGRETAKPAAILPGDAVQSSSDEIINNPAGTYVGHSFPFYVNERGNRVFCVPKKVPAPR